MRSVKSKLALACLAVMMSQSAIAQSTGGINGVLTDTRELVFFEGAEVEIKELGLSTVSRRDGSFRFTNLPEGDYTLVVKYLGARTLEVPFVISANRTLEQSFVLKDTAIENVIVYGQRAGKAGALNRQRSASNIKSVVSADAIGQFPDQNAAEALQRLPGLSIERDQGEGRFVGIRGIDPNLNNVTINGLNVPSPESGVRSVALDVIPSELVQGLEVSKSVTPDMDADAIGGSIEVKSLSAFDRNGPSASVTVQASHNDLRDEVSPKVSGNYTRVLADKWGVAAALSYFDRDFGSDNIESNGDDEIEQRYYTINRERIGAALNIDFRPDADNQYYFRNLYSEFADDEQRLANVFTFDGDESEVVRENRDRKETQSIFSTTAGAIHQFDRWLVEYQVGYSKSDEDEPDVLTYEFATSEDVTLESDMLGEIPSITQDPSVFDLASYELDEISFENNYAEDTETSFKIDATRYIDLDDMSLALKFGGKYRDREKQNEANVSLYDGGDIDIDPADFGTASPDWGLGEFGPGLSRSGLRSFFNREREAIEEALIELESDLSSEGETYLSEENILALYFMGTIDLTNLRIVAGFRYEETEFSTSGSRVELIENEEIDVERVDITASETDRTYDHLLPSLNVRYEFNEKLIGRFAFSQTISRPTFEDSGAYQIIESATEEDDGEFVTEREAEVGNPDLDPLESDNIDVSLEYYPGDIGVLSAGYFHKDIDNFVIVADVAGTPGWESFDSVTQRINGESASIDGLELSWVKAFDSGLLVSVNGTFSSSDAVTFLDGERYETSLPNQSDQVGNFTLGYESEIMSLRLTTTYKSENLEEIDGDLIRMEDDHQQIDFTGKYFINKDLHIYFNAINITDEPFYNYFDRREINAQYEEYGRTLEFGVTWKM